MNSIQELKMLNDAYAIFEQYRIESSLYPQLGGGDYFVVEKQQVYDIIRDMAALFEETHPQWNFGKHPDDDDEAGSAMVLK